MNHSISGLKQEANHPLHPEIQDKGEEEQLNQKQKQEFFHILEQEFFTSLEHQIVGHLSEYGINEFKNGFSVTFNMVLRHPEEEGEKRKLPCDIFQTGTTAKKNIQLQLQSDMNLKIIYRIGKEKDFLLSQTKIKYNKQYFIGIVIEKSFDIDGKEVHTLYLYESGIVQGMVSITTPIELPTEQIFMGSNTVPVFTGEIRDLVIVNRALSMDEIQYISKDKKLNPQEQQLTISLLDDYQQIHHQSPEQLQKQTLSLQQKHSLPLSLSKTHISIPVEMAQTQSQQLTEEEIQKRMFEQSVVDIENLLVRDNYLNDKCRELCYNFKWIFNTLYMLSPPVESKNGQSLPFICLNKLIANDAVQNDDFFPVYCIELDRFMNVLKYADLPLTRDDIMLLGHTSKWLRYYKYKEENMQEIIGIIYDKFMLCIRNSCMTPTEIREIKKECGTDAHLEPPKEGDNFEFDSYHELLQTCKKMGLTFEETKQFRFIGLTVQGIPFKGGNPRICCSQDPRLKFFESILTSYPDFYFNESACIQLYETIGGGQEISLQSLTTYCLETMKLFTEEEKQTDDCADHCRKLFQCFIFYDENLISYKEFETVLRSIYPVCLYSNNLQEIAIYPGSSELRQLIYGYYEEPQYTFPQRQIGGLRFMDRQDGGINYITSEIKEVQLQWIDIYLRDDESKMWNKVRETEKIMGSWTYTSGGVELQIQHKFQYKQKIRFNFMINNWFQQNSSQSLAKWFKINIGDILGGEGKQNQFVQDFEMNDVVGKLQLQYDISSEGEDFIDYLKAGVKLKLAFGLDWTASNGNLHEESSLHYYNKKSSKKWNIYQLMLLQLIKIFSPFDQEKLIQLWGFGADQNFTQYGLPDCFALNGNEESAECNGLADIMKTYEKFLQVVELGTRTVYKPILSKIFQKIQKSQNYTEYTLAVIMADTENYDVEDIKNLIVEASEFPITFVIIGVGNDEFNELQYLNDFTSFQHTSGKKCIRQCSLFYRQKGYQSKDKLSQKILIEFQKQLKIYYKMHKITPEKITELKQPGKTPLHILDPDKFDKKKIEEKKDDKKQAKKGKKAKKDEDEKQVEEVYIPQYVEVDKEQLENPPTVTLRLRIDQSQNSLGGTFVKLFKNLNILDQIPNEQFNYTYNFFNPNDQILGFKFKFHIDSQIKSQMFRDHNLVINKCQLEDIAPVYLGVQNAYEWPLTEDEKEVIPVPCEQWNHGKFQVVVERCANCREHSSTSWHDEADFAEKFNEFGVIFKDLFLNIEIIGNYDKPSTLECFDIYIRGVGPQMERDEQGRIWIFKKQEKLKSFLNNFEKRMLIPYDKLVLLSAGYADSLEMEKVQEHFIQQNSRSFPRKWKNATDNPCEIPERQKELQAAKDKSDTIQTGTKMLCKNWGCFLQYEYSEDPVSTKFECKHHPGSYQMGSIHGLWPESWTCCRGSWGEKGCTKGKHRGVPEKRVTFLCLNRGKINPTTGTPDSCCGREYSESGDSVECLFHNGFFKRVKQDEGQFTCCSDLNINSRGCHTATHRHAVWPDEEAKMYFIEKPAYSTNWREIKVIPFSKIGTKSCIYRESVPYKPFVSLKTQKYHERLANESEQRICMHNGCQKKFMKFKEQENKQAKDNKKKNCLMHPGKFDFGHIGVKSVSSQGNQEVLWTPHWTCCRREWQTEGCTAGYHWGPVESEMAKLKFGRWPDVSAMKYFHKEGSYLWKKKLDELMINEDTAKIIWNKFTKGKKSIQSSQLPELCDKFKLHLLLMSEDLSFHFKFNDVVKGIAQQKLLNEKGEISRDTFFKWWYTPLDNYEVNWNN